MFYFLLIKFAVINHPDGFAHAPFDGTRFDEFDADDDVQRAFDFFLNPFAQRFQLLHFIRENLFVDFNLHFKLIQRADAIDDQQIMRLGFFDLQQDAFDLRRENVDAANNQHVVRASAHFADAGRRSAAMRACVFDHRNDVAGAVANQRNPFFCERCNDEFAGFAVLRGNIRAGLDDFRVKMIREEMQAVLAFDALNRDAGADDFGEAVNIYRL